MEYTLRTVHITLSTVDTAHLEKKLGSLEKLLTPPFAAQVTIRHDTHHRKGAVVSCTVKLTQGKSVFHAVRTANTVATSIDATARALAQELAAAKNKTLRRSRRKSNR